MLRERETHSKCRWHHFLDPALDWLVKRAQAKHKRACMSPCSLLLCECGVTCFWFLPSGDGLGPGIVRHINLFFLKLLLSWSFIRAPGNDANRAVLGRSAPHPGSLNAALGENPRALAP